MPIGGVVEPAPSRAGGLGRRTSPAWADLPWLAKARGGRFVLLGAEPGGGFELEAQLVVGAAFVGVVQHDVTAGPPDTPRPTGSN
jgi:hypothetical protein